VLLLTTEYGWRCSNSSLGTSESYQRAELAYLKGSQQSCPGRTQRWERGRGYMNITVLTRNSVPTLKHELWALLARRSTILSLLLLHLARETES